MLPALFRRGSGVPSLAQVLSCHSLLLKVGALMRVVAAARPYQALTLCWGKHSIPSPLLLQQCLVDAVSTRPPCPISQLKSPWLKAQLLMTLAWVTRAKPLTSSS
ncbi:hypothetical protein I79_008793 [Cricetulus griseus]|uniref:Uncharacterized protein n=1 Tax=Cricetulus griseus TaxID=10029 RepID=G3HE24_CRIGR|nr:hypothetical protein I79_008793 [Cricetulus griseus]